MWMWIRIQPLRWLWVSSMPRLLNFTFRAHAEYFGEPIAASTGVLLTRVASADGGRLGSTVIDTHDRAELHGVRATPDGFVLVGRVLSELRSDGGGWNVFFALVGRDGTPGPYSVVDVDRGDVLFDVAALPSGQYLALVPRAMYRIHPARVYPKLRSHCWYC